MGKNRKTLKILLVAATFEKANTYVFAERLIRNAEVRRSNPPLLPQLTLSSSITYKGHCDFHQLRPSLL